MADDVSGAAEEIAFRLMLEVAYVESKNTRGVQGSTVPDRKWLLDTYAECLLAVKMPARRLP
jgi:hypothetical protein